MCSLWKDSVLSMGQNFTEMKGGGGGGKTMSYTIEKGGKFTVHLEPCLKFEWRIPL